MLYSDPFPEEEGGQAMEVDADIEGVPRGRDSSVTQGTTTSWLICWL